MPRPRTILRILTRITYVMTLLLTLTLITFWIRSYFKRDLISRSWSVAWAEMTPLTSPPAPARHYPIEFWQLSSGKGSISFAFAHNDNLLCMPTPDTWPLQVNWGHQATAPSFVGVNGTPRWAEEWGFGYAFENVPTWKFFTDATGSRFWNKTWYIHLAWPYWIVILPLTAISLTPPIRHVLSRNKRRIAKGLCPKCAYDLRASKDRCPECGTPIASNARMERGA